MRRHCGELFNIYSSRNFSFPSNCVPKISFFRTLMARYACLFAYCSWAGWEWSTRHPFFSRTTWQHFPRVLWKRPTDRVNPPLCNPLSVGGGKKRIEVEARMTHRRQSFSSFLERKKIRCREIFHKIRLLYDALNKLKKKSLAQYQDMLQKSHPLCCVWDSYQHKFGVDVQHFF